MPRQHLANKLTLILTLLLTPFAPAISAPDTTPPLNGIAHVALRVKDLAASTAFYQSLGFEMPFSLSRDGAVYESFIKINDTQFIELYPTTEKDPDPAFLHLCFEGADLQAIYDDYKSRGLNPTPVRKAGAGNLLFTMPGPEQPSGPQNIEYTQYMPGSRHTLDQGQHLGPDRIADRLIGVTISVKDADAARDFYINGLQFKPISHNPMFLHLPGESGQQVQISPANIMGNRARITLVSDNLGKATRTLKKHNITVTQLKDSKSITLTDPDDNVIIVEPR
jgi:catechol 2,3-dioxygenase-like lactoylglutathione lyase family enzyme